MSGAFNLAARLSTGEIISKRVWQDIRIGHRSMNDEQFFINFFTNYLEGEKKRLILNSDIEVTDHCKDYNFDVSIVAPYQYGFCFIDFIDKTIDHYNIDYNINKTNTFIFQNDILLPFLHEYAKYFKTINDDFKGIISTLLENNFKYAALSDFLYAYEQRDLNTIFVNEYKETIERPFDVNFNDIFRLFLSNIQNGFSDINGVSLPLCFSYKFPGLKVNYNKKDIDLDKIEEIKNNLSKKGILNKGDLLGWEFYKEELLS